MSKKWTVLVYLAGDNNLDEDGASDLAEMAKVGSNDDLNIVAQFDRAGKVGTQRFYITKGGGYQKDSIENLGETNCGDPKVLVDFLKWGIVKYPAERYMAVLWNHGSGWDEDDVYNRAIKASPEKDGFPRMGMRAFRRGRMKKAMFSTTVDKILAQTPELRAIAYDDESKDFLDNAEMKNALSEAAKELPNKRFDVVGFDACLMNAIEVSYQLKDVANVIVGSEETEPGTGWPYDEVLAALAQKPSMSPQDFGKAIVDSYIKSYDGGLQSEPVTMSAVNLDKIDPVVSKIDQWAIALEKNVTKPTTFNTILLCSERAQHFEFVTYKDAFDLARLLKEKSKVKDVKDSSKAVMNSLKPGDKNFVIASGCLSSRMANAHGVAIYFPGQQMYKKYYDALDFAKATRWEEFIKSYRKALASM